MDGDRGSASKRSQKSQMVKLSVRRIKQLSRPASACLENLSISIELLDIDKIVSTMTQLSCHFGYIGAQRCKFLCERMCQMERSESSARDHLYIAAYPCLMELYFQFLLYIDYQLTLR